MSVKVLIVDDQAPFRHAARAVTEATDGFVVVGEAETGEASVELRLFAADEPAKKSGFGKPFAATFAKRKQEADAFYAQVIHPAIPEEDRHVARRAYATPPGDTACPGSAGRSPTGTGSWP